MLSYPERPVAWKLTPAQYTATEKEALVLIKAVEHYSVNLLGCKFELVTLRQLQSMTNGNARLIRWSLALQNFIVVVFHSGGVVFA